jgi:hypothetical protein
MCGMVREEVDDQARKEYKRWVQMRLTDLTDVDNTERQGTTIGRQASQTTLKYSFAGISR